MRDYSSILLTGFAVIILLGENTSVRSHPCNVYKEDGYWHADCKNKGLTDVPQDLEEYIEYLDLSNNRFHELNEMSFKRYEKLISLTLKKSEMVNETVEFYVFRKLENLEILDLTRSNLTKYPTFYWPSSLRILKISYVWAMDVTAFDLPKLEELHASNNFISAFPFLNEQAPIRYINLDKNSLTTITAEQLAPFCRLRYLGLDLPDDAMIKHPTRYCSCVRLKQWMKDYEVATNGFNCTPRKGNFDFINKLENLSTKLLEDSYHCDVTFSDSIMAKRKLCTMRKTYDLFTVLLVCLAIMAFFTLILLSYVYIRRRRERQRSQQFLLRKPNLMEQRPIPFNFGERDLDDRPLHPPMELPLTEQPDFEPEVTDESET